VNTADSERLMTIADLSVILGIPIDTLTAGGTAVLDQPATGSVDTSAIAVTRSKPGWLDRPMSDLRTAGSPWPTSNGARRPDGKPQVAPVRSFTTACATGIRAADSAAKRMCEPSTRTVARPRSSSS
jgi:hypothetical protein